MESLKNLYCEASERSFVGCVVQGEGAPLDQCHANDEHFFDVTARQVFEVAKALYLAGKPVNSRTVLRSFQGESAERLQRLSDVCFYPSPAQAGHFFDIINEKLMLRRAHEITQWASGEVLTTDSPKDFCAEFQVKVSGVDSNAATENVLAATCNAIDDKLDRMKRGEIVRGIPMKRIPPWDNNFGGLMPGQLYALAGRPGVGKTALLEMLIAECLEQDAPVAVFEKDMSPQKLIERLACRACGVQFWRLARGAMHGWEIDKLKQMMGALRESPIHLYNPSGLTADRMCQIARRDVRVNGVKAVFLDHIQALKVGKDLREGLTQASLSIRANVTETNVPHVILAHINRNGAKGRPTPEDIKEFDQLYGDCDGMMILWSEHTRAEMATDEMMTTKFYTAKNRDGGIAEDEMLFEGSTMTFKPKAKV